jgi:hypothetical protein
MSLKEKAKTTNDVVKWALEIKEWESYPYIPLDKLKVAWVRLEDAEQAIVEVKQKLQQLLNQLPLTYHRDGDRFEFYSLGTKQEWEWWLKKFEELLKEVEQI